MLGLIGGHQGSLGHKLGSKGLTGFIERVTRLHPDLDMTAGAHQDSDSTVWGSSEVIQAQPGFSGLVRAHQHSDVARQGSSGLRRCSPRVVEAHQGSSGLRLGSLGLHGVIGTLI